LAVSEIPLPEGRGGISLIPIIQVFGIYYMDFRRITPPLPLPGTERGDSPFPFREGGRGVRSVNQ